MKFSCDTDKAMARSKLCKKNVNWVLKKFAKKFEREAGRPYNRRTQRGQPAKKSKKSKKVANPRHGGGGRGG